jgi:hypothetical protein
MKGWRMALDGMHGMRVCLETEGASWKPKGLGGILLIFSFFIMVL